MPKKWSDVAGSSAFKALTPDQQDGARRQYFNEVVAPQVPPDKTEEVWNQFSTDTGAGRRELPAGVSPSNGRRTAQDPRRLDADASIGTEPIYDIASGIQIGEKPIDTVDTRPIDERRTHAPGRTTAKDVPRMTAGSVARDVASGALQIGPTIVKGLGDLTRLATGDTVGKGLTDFADRGIETIQEIVGSERGAAQRKLFQQDMQDPALSAADVIMGNPSALADQILPTVGSMAIPVGAAGAAGKLATAGRAAQLAKAIDEGTVLARAARAREAGATAATVAQNAGSTFSDIRDAGGELDSAYTGAAITAPATYVAGRLTGGGAEVNAANLLAGTAKGAVKAVPKAMAREGAQEAGEEAGSYVGETVGKGDEFDANAAGKRMAVAGTLGAAMGGGVEAAGAIREKRIKTLRDAGEDAAAELLQKKHDHATVQEAVDSELQRMPGNELFANAYRGLRTNGVKPVEAAARSAVNVTFQGVSEASGIPQQALGAAMEKAKDMPLNEVPGFFQRFTAALVKRGLVQPNELLPTIGANLEAARDDAMETAVGAMYNPIKPAMDSAQALENPENTPLAPTNAAPEAINSVAQEDAVPASELLGTVEPEATEALTVPPVGAAQSVYEQSADLPLLPDGTLALQGDPRTLRETLVAAGIPANSIMRSGDGVLIGRTQVGPVQQVVKSMMEQQATEEMASNPALAQAETAPIATETIANDQGQTQELTVETEAAPDQTALAMGGDATQATDVPGAGDAALQDAGVAQPQLASIDQTAHAAATSPHNDRPEPTLAQQRAGNYAMGHDRIAGMDVSIENPQGSVRRGIDPDGKPWETPMQHHYGYFRGTTAADGDKLDVFIKPGTPKDYAGPVFVIDQVDPRTGKLDEHKTILGAASEDEAKEIYKSNYTADWQGMGSITRLPLSAFKAWAAHGNKKEPLGDLITNQEVSPATSKINAPEAQTNSAQPAIENVAKLAESSVTAPAYMGRDSVPLSDGGKAFKTRKAADEARALNPGMRVVRAEGGFALTEKTPAQVAAQEAAAKRLSQPRTSPKGEPIPAHAMIAAAGGLAPSTRADMTMQGNVSVGNRKLFAGEGRGLTIEQATEKLIEDGYLPQGASHDQARDLMKRSLTKPQYTAEGTEQMAAKEIEAQRTMDEDAFEEASAAQFILESVESMRDNQFDEVYDSYIPSLDEPSNTSTENAMRALGFSEEEITNAIANESAGKAEAGQFSIQSLEEQSANDAADSRKREIPTNQDSSGRSETRRQEAVVEPTQTPAPAGVSVSAFEAELRADGTLAVKGDASAIRQALQGIRGASLLSMRGGILVGRTQADKAMTILQRAQPADLTAPTREEVIASQDRVAQVNAEDGKAQRKADQQARDSDDRKRIAKASEAAAETFELGGNALDNLTGQGGMFAEEPVGKQEPAKIEDAGQKIGGARKDRWKDRGLDLTDLDGMSESEGAELATKANVWKPDYEAMAEATEPVTAAMVKTVYDQLAAQPKKNTPEGRRNYVTMMQAVRKAYSEVKSPEDVKQAGDKLKRAIGLYTDDSDAKKQAREVLFSVYKGRSDPFVLSYNELSKAKKMVEDGFPAKGEPWKKRLTLRAYGGQGITSRGIELTVEDSAALGTPLTTDQIVSGFYRINTKDGKAVGYAPTKIDAEAAAKSIYERELKKGPAEKPEPTRPNLDSLKRENLPTRIDRDVSAEDFVKDFGFRGVEFGNWAAQDERQRIINMAYDGLMDLAEIMGVPPKAMSLNGTMGMAFGARGGGKFAAHYEPGKLVINMTKINGGGSMAHEWAHALDHYFGELNQKDAYTTKARGASGWYDEQQYKGVPMTRLEKDAQGKWANVSKMRLANLRPEMAEAFDGVMSALFNGQETKAQMVRSEELAIERYEALAAKETDPEMKAVYQRGVESRKQSLEELRKEPDGKTYPKGRSAYAGEAQKLVGKSATGYWTRPTEMFARAFESWVFDKVATMGAKSDYLVHGVEEDRFAGGGYKGNPYPTGQERATINAAFDKLTSTIQTKETDKGVAMFARGPNYDAAVDSAIAAAVKGDPPARGHITVGTTSPALQAAGLPDQNLRTSAQILAKAHFDHGVPKSMLKRIPELLDNPVMVFKSDTQAGKYVVATNEFLNGKPLLVIVSPEKNLEGVGFNFMPSVYPKDYVKTIQGWIDGGLLTYFDKKQSPQWFSSAWLQLPRDLQTKKGSQGRNVATEADVVKPADDQMARDAGDEAFRRTFAPRLLMPVTDVQAAVDKLSKKWTDGPRIKVLTIPDELPIPAPSDARGLIHNGIAYVVASNHRDAQGVARTLAHEAIGHYGLWKALGGDGTRQFQRQLNLAIKSGNVPLNKIADQVRELYVDDNGKFNLSDAAFANEVAAFAVENAIDADGNFNPGYGFLKQVWAKVADFLRGLGMDIKFTYAELQGMLVASMRGLETGKRLNGGGEVLVAAARDPGTKDFSSIAKTLLSNAQGDAGASDFISSDGQSALARGTQGLFAPTVWNTPDPTGTDKIIYELQDGRVDLKRVQQAIEKSGQQIAEKWDARLAETLYPGRVAYRSQRFLEVEAKPLLKAMATYQVPMDELADYLHARGAEERNAQVAKVNPALPDGGAGTNSKGVLLTNQAAKDYLASITPGRKVILDTLATKVDAITAGTRKLLVDEGLEKQDTIDAWTKTYKNYVPMFRDEAQSGAPHPQGSGFTVKGSASKRATGSTKEVTNILAHVLMQREAAITRAEKNRVAVSLYGQALSHPNPEFWTTIKPSMDSASIAKELQAMGVDPMTATVGMEMVPTITTVDPTTGKKVDRPNPLYKSLPGAIPLKINGEDRVLMLNTENERGARLAENLKNLDGLTAIDWSVGLLHKFVWSKIPASVAVGPATRWLASVNTQFNPAFGLVNVTRDMLGAAVNLGSTELRGNSIKVLRDTIPAMQGIARALATDGGGKWGDLYRQFQADGGQTGWKENFRDASDRAKAIEQQLQAAHRVGKLSPGAAAHAALDLLDGFNTTMENAVRLSAYSAALDNGMSRAKAAKLSRELTVDFNRKGRVGREAGPLYAFFNASVQGTARSMETLMGPTGAKVILGGLGLGALQTVMLLAAGYDDDEVPEFVKSRALVIPLNWSGKGEKSHVLIPYPLGIHVLPNTGRVITELGMNGGKNIGKRSFEAIGEIAGAFNPLGGGNIFTADGALKTMTPTLVDPLIELGFNRNFAGNSIEREAFRGETDTRPGVARTKEATQRSTTGQAYMGISKAINAMTGGTDYEAGKLSPTPERLRYIAQTVGGGVLREIEKTINASTAATYGRDVKPSALPVVGRFYGEVDDDQVKTSRYFENSTKLDKLENTVKIMTKAGDAQALDKLMAAHPEVALVKLGNKVQTAVAKLNKNAIESVSDADGIRAIDESRVEIMDVLNQAVSQLEKETTPPTPAEKIKGWRKEVAAP